MLLAASAAHVAAFHTAPGTKEELDTLVGRASQRNHTLWRYFFPDPGNRSSISAGARRGHYAGSALLRSEAVHLVLPVPRAVSCLVFCLRKARDG